MHHCDAENKTPILLDVERTDSCCSVRGKVFIAGSGNMLSNDSEYSVL